MDDWKSKVSQVTKTKWRLNAYGICSMLCAERVKGWAKSERINTPIEFIFESGDPGSGVLKELFEKDGYPPPNIKRQNH